MTDDKENIDVCVVGAGAMGTSITAYLACTLPVTLLTTTEASKCDERRNHL